MVEQTYEERLAQKAIDAEYLLAGQAFPDRQQMFDELRLMDIEEDKGRSWARRMRDKYLLNRE